MYDSRLADPKVILCLLRPNLAGFGKTPEIGTQINSLKGIECFDAVFRDRLICGNDFQSFGL